MPSSLAQCATSAYGGGTNKLTNTISCTKKNITTVKFILSLVDVGIPLIKDDIIKITVPDVKNHFSLAVSDPFKFLTYTNILDTELIHFRETGPTVTNVDHALMTTMSATPVNNFLEAVTTWTISITTYN